MPYNAIVKDEQTGEILKLWATLTEDVDFPNTITGEPLDLKPAQGTASQLAEHIHHEPMTLDITADLTGDPGKRAGALGGAGYELEQYNRLVAFVNRTTTFAYTSLLFVNQTPTSDAVVPGLTMEGLGLADFSAVKGNGRPQNIIAARIKFQSIVFTIGGQPVSPPVAWDRGRQKLDEAVAWWVTAGALAGGAAAGVAAAILAAGAGATVGWAVALGIAGGLAVTGFLSWIGSLIVGQGSVPYQSFITEIAGQDFAFELRSNDSAGFCTFSMGVNGQWLVRERKVLVGEDLLVGVVHPAARGLHIIPCACGGASIAATPETLGRTVQLGVFQEA